MPNDASPVNRIYSASPVLGKATVSFPYVYDAAASGWRPTTPDDFANINVTGLGVTVNVDQVGISGFTSPVNVGISGYAGGTPSNDTPSGTNGLAIRANGNRKQFFIQNLSTGGPAYIRLSSSLASAANFSAILKVASSLTAGDGGVLSEDFSHYKGDINISGVGVPNWIAWEIA